MSAADLPTSTKGKSFGAKSRSFKPWKLRCLGLFSEGIPTTIMIVIIKKREAMLLYLNILYFGIVVKFFYKIALFI